MKRAARRPRPHARRAPIGLALALALASFAGCRAPDAAAAAGGPTVLAIFAHPDDETTVAGALYKTSTLLGGPCDLVVITNGEGGFKYATLAERLYGLELTDEVVGRAELPAIRRAELEAAGELVGLRRIVFLGERDHRYTTDPWEVLDPAAGVWDLPRIEGELSELLRAGSYDFVLTMAPSTETHGHHQAAMVLAARAVAALPPEHRPVLLGAALEDAERGPPARPSALPGFPETAVAAGGPFVFDRTQRFGHRDALDYRIVVNWVIAAHKSQGTMQLAMNRGLAEHYFPYAVSPPDASERCARWFAALAAPQFPARDYGESAGTNAGAGPSRPR